MSKKLIVLLLIMLWLLPLAVLSLAGTFYDLNPQAYPQLAWFKTEISEDLWAIYVIGPFAILYMVGAIIHILRCPLFAKRVNWKIRSIWWGFSLLWLVLTIPRFWGWDHSILDWLPSISGMSMFWFLATPDPPAERPAWFSHRDDLLPPAGQP